MKVLFAILVLVFFGCNSNKNNQYPSKFSQILEQKPFTLVITYSVDCSVSQLYTSVLKDIYASLPSDSFQCYLLKVNAKENWDFPMNHFNVIDSGALEIAQAIGFKVFPEVAVMNAKGELLYIGAIDGRVKEIGNTHFRPLPNEMYLNSALTQLRKKHQINLKSTIAKGCFIEFDKNP